MANPGDDPKLSQYWVGREGVANGGNYQPSPNWEHEWPFGDSHRVGVIVNMEPSPDDARDLVWTVRFESPEYASLFRAALGRLETRLMLPEFLEKD